MLSIKDLKGSSIQATDGAIGTVDSCYFDEDYWAVRYLVVDTGNWLPGRHVLISPLKVTGIDEVEKTVRVSLTREQVEKSPPAEPLTVPTREQEAAYLGYYGLPRYWEGLGLWGAAGVPGIPSVAERAPEPLRYRGETRSATATLNTTGLRDTKDVIGSYIRATDGEIGHVDDFIVADDSWLIRYMVVDTSNWWAGRKVLVAPRWITDINWAESIVDVSMTKDAIKSSPEYNPLQPIERDYEAKLYRHYNRPGYWTD